MLRGQVATDLSRRGIMAEIIEAVEIIEITIR